MVYLRFLLNQLRKLKYDLEKLIGYYNHIFYPTESHKYITLPEDSLDAWLRPPSKDDLIRQGKVSHHRQQKIVGGMPVKYGEQAPWTVRYFTMNSLS